MPERASESKNTIRELTLSETRELTLDELEIVGGGNWIEGLRDILFRHMLPYKLPAVAGQRC